MEREPEPKVEAMDPEGEGRQPVSTEERDIYRATIVENSEQYMAAAYAGFLARGRGIILVDRADRGPENPNALALAVYVHEPLILERWRGWPSTELQDLVESYDPETEMVCVVERRGAGIRTYRITASTSSTAPPAAFRRRQQMARPLLRERAP